jgi:2-dehydro-3-deoxygluconokinase
MAVNRPSKEQPVQYGLNLKTAANLDFVSLGDLNHRVDSVILPFYKAVEWQVHLRGGEYNFAVNLPGCSCLRTGIVSARIQL